LELEDLGEGEAVGVEEEEVGAVEDFHHHTSIQSIIPTRY